MKVKVYRVVPKKNEKCIFYMVDALSKRIRFNIKNLGCRGCSPV